MPLTFAETPLYYKDSQGNYHRILSGADMTGYRTASAQDVIDTAQDADIASRAKTDMLGIVIDGNSTPVGASAGQYVIVKNSTITGITDGLYTAAKAIPANTAIDATYLTAVSGGGHNSVKSFFLDPPIIKYKDFTYNVTIPANGFLDLGLDSTYYLLSGYTVIGSMLYTGSTVELRNLITVTAKNIINHKGFIVKNYHTAALSGKITIRVFYIRNGFMVSAT